jgi:periplasmic protein TonB
MATRAFLLCGDEKAVHAVTQILDELEVCYEHSSEPAFCLKRLAAQKFDLLIVDCDNAQNATQVFNSARASNLNKNSIAIAIVEGKAGVPNAFRLGASLVLTKPVSLEQVRNTLRTGIGMARKDATEVKAPVSTYVPATASPASTPLAPALTPASPGPAATQVAPPPVLAPVPVRTVPAAAPTVAIPPASASEAIGKISVSAPPAPPKPTPVVPRPAPAPAAPVQENKPAAPVVAERKPALAPVAQTEVKATAAAAGPVPAKNFDSIFAASPVSEASTKPSSAKPLKDEDRKLELASPLKEKEVNAKAEVGTDDSDGNDDLGVPSFGGMGELLHGEEEESNERGGKGALIAALVLGLLGVAGYGAWATQPEFRNFIAWEFQNVSSKIAAFRGQASASAPVDQEVPAPAPVASAPAVAPNRQAADLNGSPASANAAAAAATVPAAASPASAAPQPADPVPADNTQKAAVQPAKQDTDHTGSTPALVAASASIPPTASAKSTNSDLLEVPEDFADDQVIHRVHPNYPRQARVRKLRGAVVLEAVVNKQGKVDSLQLVSGDPLLAQAAADAVKQWRYKPYLHNGEYTEFQTRVTVEFKQP